MVKFPHCLTPPRALRWSELCAHAEEAHFQSARASRHLCPLAVHPAVDGQAVPSPTRGPPRLEGELAIIVGKELWDVTRKPPSRLLRHACFNDLSARKFQMASDRWTLGKILNSSGPLGRGSLRRTNPNPDQLRIQTYVTETASRMGTRQIYLLSEKLASYGSGAMTLKPATSSPRHSGCIGRPETTHVLHPGDTVAVEIERIGRITNRIVKR